MSITTDTLAQPGYRYIIYESVPQLIDACRKACGEGNALQYSIRGTRKSGMLDITTCSMMAQVWDAISDKNKAATVRLWESKFDRLPSRLATFMWKATGNAKGRA